MKLLEYEAKNLLAESDVPVPNSTIIAPMQPTPALPVVIKSQVPVGGRGKAGGIAIVSTESEFEQAVERILNLSIAGHYPRTLLSEALIDIKQELYVSVIIDVTSACLVVMAHKNGGVEVEENDASEFLRIPVTDDSRSQMGERLSEYYDLPGQAFAFQDLMDNLLHCFVANDAILLEINPLVLTMDDKIIAGDCKMELDDAAAFRHADWSFEQKKAEVNFVTLDDKGTVATIANGAGLAMATVDAVADAGMTAANFLDIGGGANEKSVLVAFERIMKYPSIHVIIINIFAGITRCDEVANAIIAARSHIPTLPPLCIRLAGTNYEAAVELLSAAGIPTVATLDECIIQAKEMA